MALLFALDVLAFEHGTLRPFLKTMAVLLIVFPLAFISSSFDILVNPKSISLVIHPSAFVSITVSMVENSLSKGLIELPLTCVFGSIRPEHSSLPVPHATTPVAIVHSSSLVLMDALSNGLVYFKFLIVVKSFSSFISFEILTLHLGGQLHHGISPSL
jgi:hypothetical protein